MDQPKQPDVLPTDHFVAPQRQDLTVIARKFTKKALKTLLSIMEDPSAPANARILAAKEILSRGHGQAPARIDLARQLNDEDLERMAHVILQRRMMTAVKTRKAVAEVRSKRLLSQPRVNNRLVAHVTPRSSSETPSENVT